MVVAERNDTDQPRKLGCEVYLIERRGTVVHLKDTRMTSTPWPALSVHRRVARACLRIFVGTKKVRSALPLQDASLFVFWQCPLATGH